MRLLRPTILVTLTLALVITVSAGKSGKKSSSSSSSSDEDSPDETRDCFCKAGKRPVARRLDAVRGSPRSRRNSSRGARSLRGDDDDDHESGDDDDDHGSGDDDDSESCDDASATEDLIQFESGFFISYAGAEGESIESFDTDDISSIAFLQESIQFIYNGEIGCSEGGEQFDVTSVVLDSQIVLENPEGARNLQFGFGFTLSNFYKVFGNCRFCAPSSPPLVNDGFRRRLAAAFDQKRQLQDGEIPQDTANFNREIVPQLNGRTAFSNIMGASITNDLLPMFAEQQRTFEVDEFSNDVADDEDDAEEDTV